MSVLLAQVWRIQHHDIETHKKWSAGRQIASREGEKLAKVGGLVS